MEVNKSNNIIHYILTYLAVRLTFLPGTYYNSLGSISCYLGFLRRIFLIVGRLFFCLIQTLSTSCFIRERTSFSIQSSRIRGIVSSEIDYYSYYSVEYNNNNIMWETTQHNLAVVHTIMLGITISTST